MALANYIEMRDAVIDPRYLLKRELERELERRHPDQFVPRYTMVMFRRLPYAQAQQRGRVNGQILDQLTDGIERLEQVDFDRAAALAPAPPG